VDDTQIIERKKVDILKQTEVFNRQTVNNSYYSVCKYIYAVRINK